MKAKPNNPAYPDAHPTAPGGMSKKALIAELAEKHSVTVEQSSQMSWPELIESVCEGRLAREREAGAKAVAENIAERYGADVFAASEEYVADALDRIEYGDAPPDYSETVKRVTEMFEDESDPADGADDLLADLDGLLEDSKPEPVMLPKPRLRRGDPGCPQCKHGTHGMTGCPDMDTDCQCTYVRPNMLTRVPRVLDYVFNGHMGAGPSASERWINCTASLGASRTFLETLTPNQQAEFSGASLAARQGTVAHAASEAGLLTALGRASQEELDATLMELAVHPLDGEEYTEEMAEHIGEYVDLMMQIAHERGDDHVLVEHTVEAIIPLVGLHEGETYAVRGSADGVGLPTKDDPNLVVADLKYGNGINVEVEDNSQAKIYALGVLDSLTDDEGYLITPVETITYYIIQPRLGGVKTVTETLDELLDWRDDVLSPALTAALYGEDEGAVFSPSDTACQWCPARGGCAALTEQRFAAASDLFDAVVMEEAEPSVLSNERLGDLAAQAATIAKLADELKAEVQRRLYRGTDVPGYHLVNYTPPRYWDEDAKEALSVDLFDDEGGIGTRAMREKLWVTEPRLLSPTQALALFKKDEGALAALAPLIVAPPKKPVAAPIGDRRSAWTGLAPEAMFADETVSGNEE